MTVTAWRIVTACHVQNAFDGEGARLYGGRWNPPGIAVVYTAGSLSLAALEMLAGLNSMQLLSLFTGIPVTIESRHIQPIPTLPDGWDIIPAGSVSRKTGAEWIPIFKYNIAESLRDPTVFSKFYLDSWPTLAWECGFDIAPESLYFMATGKSKIESASVA